MNQCFSIKHTSTPFNQPIKIFRHNCHSPAVSSEDHFFIIHPPPPCSNTSRLHIRLLLLIHVYYIKMQLSLFTRLPLPNDMVSPTLCLHLVTSPQRFQTNLRTWLFAMWLQSDNFPSSILTPSATEMSLQQKCRVHIEILVKVPCWSWTRNSFHYLPYLH